VPLMLVGRRRLAELKTSAMPKSARTGRSKESKRMFCG